MLICVYGPLNVLGKNLPEKQIVGRKRLGLLESAFTQYEPRDPGHRGVGRHR